MVLVIEEKINEKIIIYFRILIKRFETVYVKVLVM